MQTIVENSLLESSCLVLQRWFEAPSRPHVKCIVEDSFPLFNLNRFTSYKETCILLDVYLGIRLCGGLT